MTAMTTRRSRCLAATDDAARISGATYREIDHWTRRGYLTAGCPGSGQWRGWTPAQISAAAEMARLVRAGLTPAAAARVAHGETELAPGIRVEVTR